MGVFYFLFSYRLKLRSDEKRWGGLPDQPRVFYGGKLSSIFFPTLAERLIRILLTRNQDQLKSLQNVLQSQNGKKNLRAILAARWTSVLFYNVLFPLILYLVFLLFFAGFLIDHCMNCSYNVQVLNLTFVLLTKKITKRFLFAGYFGTPPPLHLRPN